MVTPACDPTPDARCLQLGSQLVAQARGVRENQPRLLDWRLQEFFRRKESSGGRVVPGFPGEQTDLAFAFGTEQARQRSGFCETRLSQEDLPLGTPQQRMERSQISIGKAPPATHEAKDGLCP